MKKKSIFSLLILSSAMVLASCGQGGTSSQASEDQSASQPSSSQGSQGSQESTARKYVIRINNTAGVTITSDKEKAEAGETVTLTVALAEGYTLTSLTAGSQALTVYEGVATFTMPDDDIVVKATVSVSGDVVLDGTVAAPFTKVSETRYEAKGVEVDVDSYCVIKAGSVQYGWMELDKYNSFGEIEFQYQGYDESKYTVTPISLAGKAAYDIVLDLTKENPVTVQRSEVLALPSTVKEYSNLFGAMSVHKIINPVGVNHVTYTSATLNKTYEWKRYADNSSYASVKGLSPLDTSVKHVYRSVKDGIYTTVNNFTAGLQDRDVNWLDESPKQSKIDDKAMPYSAKYEISDEISQVADQRYYQKGADEAQYMVDHYYYDLYAIDFVQHEGYRTGFDSTYNNTLKDYNISIKSLANADGGFTTSIESYKSFEADTDDSTIKPTHIEYRINCTFTKAGAPLSGSFTQTTYGENAYDFTKKEFKPGYEELGTLNESAVYSYEYGEAYEGTSGFDAAPYFASSITPSIVHEKETVTVTAPGTNLSDELAIACSPSSALDSWQYGIIGVSDPEMVYYNSYSYWQTDFDKEGEYTLTIGNHVDNKVTATLALENKITSYIRQFGFNDTYDPRTVTYTSTWVMAGETYAIQLGTQAFDNYECVGIGSAALGDKGSLKGITFSYNKEGYIDCSVNTKTRKLIINATGAVGKMSKEETSIDIKVTVNSPYYGNWDPTVLTITVYNVDTSISEAYIPGTWEVEKEVGSADGDQIVFTDTLLASGYKAGTITLNESGVINTWSFGWEFNGTELKIHNVAYTSGTTYKDYMYFGLSTCIEWQTNKIGFYFVASSVSGGDEGEWSGKETIILGDYTEDEEGYVEYSYVFFAKNA